MTCRRVAALFCTEPNTDSSNYWRVAYIATSTTFQIKSLNLTHLYRTHSSKSASVPPSKRNQRSPLHTSTRTSLRKMTSRLKNTTMEDRTRSLSLTCQIFMSVTWRTGMVRNMLYWLVIWDASGLLSPVLKWGILIACDFHALRSSTNTPSSHTISYWSLEVHSIPLYSNAHKKS